MARRDYYIVLGVSRTVSQEDLKRAFRGLALQYHPDRNPDDPDATRRFREISEAYQVLSDPEQRARYDKLGPLFRMDGRPPTPEDLNAFVADALAGLFGRRRPGDKGEDLKYTLTVTLEEAGLGTHKEIELRRRVPCTRCEATGAEPGVGRSPCPACEGSGKSQARRLFRSECPRCDGRGFLVVEKCKRCEGAGVRDDTERFRVRVPAGVATGTKLKLRGKGSFPRGDGPPGDLVVLMDVEDHALFRRRGADLFLEAPLTYAEATLGTELTVPTLDGQTRIRVPAGSPSGKIFRLSGRGLHQDRGKPGDLHVKVVVEVPTNLSPAARRALDALQAALPAQAHPGRSAWDAALLGRSPPVSAADA